LVVRERQNHVRADLELSIDLDANSALRPPTLGTFIRPGSTSVASPTIENNLHVSVVPKPLDQILVETGVAAGNQEHVSGHGPFNRRSTVIISHSAHCRARI